MTASSSTLIRTVGVDRSQVVAAPACSVASSRWLAIICATLAGLLTAAAWLPGQVSLEMTPDSADYRSIAINLATGRGYLTFDDRIADNRSPLYPVLLASLYDKQSDVWNARIVSLHRFLAFVIGFSIVLYSAIVFGRTGIVCGVLTTVLISADDELAYAGAQLLTELPATSLLCAAMLVAHWTHSGSLRREWLMAVVQICLFMTRSALVFCGIAYGLYLVYRACVERSASSFQRVAVFGLPCAVAVMAWGTFMWANTGGFTPLTSTGPSNLAAGLSPETVATSVGWPVPRTDVELESFWTGAPAVPNTVLVAALKEAVGHPMRAAKLMASKLKVAFHRSPIGVFFLGIFGIGLQICSRRHPVSSTPQSGMQTTSLRRIAGRFAYQGAACSCLLAVCGFSHPALRVAVLVATAVIVLCHVSPAGEFLEAPRNGDALSATLLMVFGGFVLMTLATFGLPRFTRPFLPALYLSATLCVPLAFKLWNQSSPCVRSDAASV